MVCQHYRRRFYLNRFSTVALAAVLVALALSDAAHSDDTLVPYRISDGTIPAPLTAQPGDPERGRRIVLDRDRGDCTICHQPLQEEPRFLFIGAGSVDANPGSRFKNNLGLLSIPGRRREHRPLEARILGEQANIP